MQHDASDSTVSREMKGWGGTDRLAVDDEVSRNVDPVGSEVVVDGEGIRVRVCLGGFARCGAIARVVVRRDIDFQPRGKLKKKNTSLQRPSHLALCDHRSVTSAPGY